MKSLRFEQVKFVQVYFITTGEIKPGESIGHPQFLTSPLQWVRRGTSKEGGWSQGVADSHPCVTNVFVISLECV